MSIISSSSLALPGGYENGNPFPFGFAPGIVRGPGDVVYTKGQHVDQTGHHENDYIMLFKTDYATGIVGPIVHDIGPLGADNFGNVWTLVGSVGIPQWGIVDPSSGAILFTFPNPYPGPNPANTVVGANFNSFLYGGINYVGYLSQAFDASFSNEATNLVLHDASNGSLLWNIPIPAQGQAWIDFAFPSGIFLSDGLGYCYATSFDMPSSSITGAWIFKVNLATGSLAVYSYSGIYGIVMDYTNKQIFGFTQGGSVQVIDCATMAVISTIPNVVSTAGNQHTVVTSQDSVTYGQSTRDKAAIVDPLHCSFLAIKSISPLTLRRLHLPDFSVIEDVSYPPSPVNTTKFSSPLYLYDLEALIISDYLPSQWRLNYSPSVCTGGSGGTAGGQRARVWIST